MRIVLDTNVAFSALLWRGTPYRLIETLRHRRHHRLFTSPALLNELADILTRPLAVKRLSLALRTADDMLADYAGFVETVVPVVVPTVVATDPDDDNVIAAAIAADADLIISGDRDLLDLKTHGSIEIVSPATALARLL